MGCDNNYVITVQLKGNLIPTQVVQVDTLMKITSCVLYLNGCLLHLCLHQANHRACAPTNVALISNKLSDET